MVRMVDHLLWIGLNKCHVKYDTPVVLCDVAHEGLDRLSPKGEGVNGRRGRKGRKRRSINVYALTHTHTRI